MRRSGANSRTILRFSLQPGSVQAIIETDSRSGKAGGAATAKQITLNGIDVTTGGYLTPPVAVDDLARMVLDQPLEDVEQERWRIFLTKEKKAALRDGHDPKRLSDAGWALLLADDADPGIEQALEPLLSLRHKQVDNDDRFRILRGQDGYRHGDGKIEFLKRSGATPAGRVDPDKLPYYVLVVGSPSRIPFEFQYQLDVAYAVGRLHLDDLSAYRHYADSVVEFETRPHQDVRSGFLGTAHPGDSATQRSAQDLVRPLALAFERSGSGSTNYVTPETATKEALGDLLRSGGSPTMAFVAAHGLGTPVGYAGQSRLQGALLCQDWPGPGHPVERPHYFGGADVLPGAHYGGLIVFLFACYGAGTPRLDDFSTDRNQPVTLAPEPFVAALPKSLLGQPEGAALAVIGHVDRAWTYSFDWPEVGPQTAIFADTLHRLLAGYPVGYAMEMFNERHAELAVDLHESEGKVGTAGQLTFDEIAGLWTAKNDSRNYAILGDPAVRLVMP